LSHPLTPIEDEMYRLVEITRRQNILLRLMGGLAVKVQCTNSANPLNFQRNYPDLDFVTNGDGGRRLEAIFIESGYTPDRRLNLLTGDRRQLYYDETNRRQVDIFINAIEMSHHIPLGSGRLEVDPITIPLAELFLSKAQIVQLNRKDVLDLLSLVLVHPLGAGDQAMLNSNIISRLCGSDWGLFTTVIDSLDKMLNFLTNEITDLGDNQVTIIQQHCIALRDLLERTPKTAVWKARSIVGKRMKWYNEVEEVQR
jgi:hypothetical protein